MSLSKFQTILLIVFGALAVAGVLIFAFAVGGGNNNTVGPIVIWGTMNQNAFTTVIRQAAETNPSLSQVSYVQKDPATYEAEITNALASGQGPDLFLMSQDRAVVNIGKIAPIPYEILSASNFEATFAPAAKAFLSNSGVEAIPLVLDPLVLYWNKDLLGSAGFPRAPQYWDEVVPMATYVTGGNKDVNGKAVTRRDDSNAIVKSAIAFGEYRNVENAKDILATLILQAGGLITARDTSGHLTPALSPKSSENAQSTISALRFYTEFADPSRNLYSWSRALPDARQGFAAGDIGMYVGYASEESLIRSTNPNLNFGVAPIPQIRASEFAINTARAYGLSISRNNRNPAGAQAIAYVLASAAISQNLSTALALPGARLDVLKASMPDPTTLASKTLGVEPSHDQVIATAAITARSWVDPDPDKTADVFRAMIEDTVSGAARDSDAVQRADQELGHILGL